MGVALVAPRSIMQVHTEGSPASRMVGYASPKDPEARRPLPSVLACVSSYLFGYGVLVNIGPVTDHISVPKATPEKMHEFCFSIFLCSHCYVPDINGFTTPTTGELVTRWHLGLRDDPLSEIRTGVDGGNGMAYEVVVTILALSWGTVPPAVNVPIFPQKLQRLLGVRFLSHPYPLVGLACPVASSTWKSRLPSWDATFLEAKAPHCYGLSHVNQGWSATWAWGAREEVRPASHWLSGRRTTSSTG